MRSWLLHLPGSRARPCPCLSSICQHGSAAKYAVVWEFNTDDGDKTLAEITSVLFLFNSKDFLTWDEFDLSPVGRREVDVQIIDVQISD